MPIESKIIDWITSLLCLYTAQIQRESPEIADTKSKIFYWIIIYLTSFMEASSLKKFSMSGRFLYSDDLPRVNYIPNIRYNNPVVLLGELMDLIPLNLCIPRANSNLRAR